MTTFATDIVAVFNGIDLSDDVHTHVGVGASLGAVPMEYEPVYDTKTNTWRQVEVHQGWATTAIPVVAEFDTTGELTAWLQALRAACLAGGSLTWQWTPGEAVRTYVIGASDEPEIIEDNEYLLRHRVEFTLALTRWPDAAGPLVIVEPEIIDTPEGAEGVQFSTTAWGGYGTCSYDVRPPGRPPSYGDTVDIGGGLYKGKVVNVPEMLITSAAQDEAGIVVVSGTYHVVCEGAARELGRDEAFAMAFRDRDLSEWQVSDCGEAWSAIGDGFQIQASVEGSVRLTGAAPEELMSYTSPAAATHYTSHVGNSPPASASADYPNPAGLPAWSAAWYLIQDGLTDDRISMLSCNVNWNTLTPLQDALTVPDLDSPIGWPDPDPDIANRFATYGDLNMWTGFYGGNSPGCFYGGIYACDDPLELPVNDPLAMYSDPHRLHRFPTRTSGVINGLKLGTDAKLICVYASYRPVQKPLWLSEEYDETEQHLMRRYWCALNRYYAEPGCFVELTNVVVLANSFPETCNDLAEVFPLLIAGATCVPSQVSEESSIMVRPFTTRLAAIEDLLALTDQPRVWGCYESGLLAIVEDFGAVAFDPSEPGVSVSAQLAVDGAVETCTVVYQPHDSQGAAGDRLGAAFAPHVLTVGGAPAQRNAFRDASGTAHSIDAATMEGEDEIAKRGYGMWDGQIGLENIPGGMAARGGQKVSCGAATDVLITSTSVDLDSKTATLTLGSYGYKPKFKFDSGKRLGGGGRGGMPDYALRKDGRRQT